MRGFRKITAFHFLATLMLGVGIAATTAIFSVVSGVLLQPLPFRDPERLVLVGERVPQSTRPPDFDFLDSPSAILAWRAQAGDFRAMAALQRASYTLVGEGSPRALNGVKVTPSFFDVIEAKPALGRTFTRADVGDSIRPMIITDALWRSAFNADPRVIERVIGAPGSEARVIGVLPSDFHMGGRELGPMTDGITMEFFVPFDFGPTSGGDLRSVWTNFNYTVIGRLKDGITLAHAAAQLDVIQARLAANAPDRAPGMTLQGRITPVLAFSTDRTRQELWLLLAAVGALLLIISVNLGGLWVSRVIDSRRQWAIRIALGAEPARLLRHVLYERLTLGLVGGALGVTLAAAMLRELLAVAPADIPRLAEVHVDWRMFALALLVAGGAGLLTGLLPALRVGKADPQEALGGGGRTATVGAASVRSRQSLIGLQSALTTLLVAVAGLLGLSLYQLTTKSTGFRGEQAVAANVVLGTYGGAQRERILRQLTAVVAAIPGVHSMGLTSHLPLQGETWINAVGVPSIRYADGQQPTANVRFVGGDYFSAMRIPLTAGRNFRESDRPAGWPPKTSRDEANMNEAVIISMSAARMIWPGRDPRTLVGQRVAFGGLTPTIVGVASDVLDGTLTSAAPPVVYLPYWNWAPTSVSLVVRTSLTASAIAGPLRAAVWNLAPNAPIRDIEPLQALRSKATAPQRYQLTLLTVFAALALLLAAIGVYALVAHSVAQRKKELAIRIALGSPVSAIRWLIAGQALAPTLIGAGAGLCAAFVGGRLLQSQLYDVGPHSAAALCAAFAVVFLAGASACVSPARRAARVDPNVSLRAD